MTQVTRTTQDIIVNAFYLIGELGVGETPDSFMLSTGIEIINAILDKFAADSIYIPYVTTVNFNFVTGQATYSISNIVPADIVADRVVDLYLANYTVNTIVYALRVINKTTFFGQVRLTNLQARPSFIFLNKQPTESFITVYPAPDQPYPCSLQLKVMIDKLDQYEDLSSIPPFYYGFLKYALARQLIAYYPSANWPQTNEDEYWDMFNIIKNANETDLTLRPSVILTTPQPFYWQNILVY